LRAVEAEHESACWRAEEVFGGLTAEPVA